MVDTGAAPNLIKFRNLSPETEIRENDRLFLSGITDGRIETLGSIQLAYKGYPVKMHVVQNNFPIPQEGILGSDFLRDASQIDFKNQFILWQGIQIPLAQRETVVIPARSRATFYVKITNPDIAVGYIPRLSVCKDVYLGDAVVTNRDGRAYLQAINASDVDRELIVPNIELEEIESISKEKFRKSPQKSYRVHAVSSDLHENYETRSQTARSLLRLEHLNDEELEHVDLLLAKHCDLFQLPGDTLNCTNTMKHKIATTDDLPINTKQYRYPPIHKDEIDKQVKELLNNEIIQPSESPYNSPLWIVPKKPDSKGNKRWRMVIDYRSLNEKTIGDAYPLPNITEILDQLGSAKYFSVFDLASGFHQIPMHEQHARKTAFSTPHGHYEFKRMPFGLKNAPATFQRLMDQVLSGLQGIELFVYLDDIVLYARSLREHQIKFDKLAERLRRANLKLQPDKCEFLRREVGYLGHIISNNGVKPDPAKIRAVKEFPRPRNEKNIKQFLGLAGYYRRFIPNFSKIAKPLTELLKKDNEFAWQKEQADAFTQLRDALCTEPVLQYPDFTKPFVVTTDASGYAIGGILSQGPVGKDSPIAYTSRLLNQAEKNYSTIEKELLAIVYCVNYFRPYLYGRKFQLVTDHKPLVWLTSVKDPTSRLVRWRLKLDEYEYQVIYKAGKTNVNADALSRNPVHKTHAANEQKTNDVQMLPIHHDQMYSSNESLFNAERPEKSPTPVSHGTENPASDNLRNTVIQEASSVTSDIANDTASEAADSEISDPESDSSSNSDDEYIFDNPNEPSIAKNLRGPRVTVIPDNFASRKDNLVIFVTQQGAPIDRGAHILHETRSLPMIRDAALARAKVNRDGNRRIISLVIKERTSEITEKEILRESLRSLLDVITELELPSISVAKGDIDRVSWETVYSLMTRILGDTDVQLFICTNKISIPPLSDRAQIITENHCSAIGGHKGVTKTYNRIKKKYNWTGMKSDIQSFIQNCRPCQLKKLVRVKTKQPMILTDTPGSAFDKISMDIMGPLPVTQSDNAYILTIQDLLTKYSLAIPLRDAGAIQVADAFTNEFICTFGAPKALLTDQGSHFLNSLMRNIASKFKIKHYKTTAYRPQSNGSIERSHQVLWEYLKQFVDRNNEWDKCLKLASFSYNTSVHEGTQFTPHELVFGKTAETPSSDPNIRDENNASYSSYLTDLFNKIKDSQAIARENLIHAKERSKRYYDRKTNIRRFKIGDRICLLKEPVKGKLGDQYTGPHEILEILKNHNVKIALSRNKTKIVHQDKIKHFTYRSPSTTHTPSKEPRQGSYKPSTRTEDRPDSHET